MALSYLTSTLVMVTLLAITAAAVVAAEWRRPEAEAPHGGHDEAFFSVLERGSAAARSGSIWFVLFGIAAAAAGLAALAFVGFGGQGVAATAGIVLIAVTVLGVVSFLVVGTYHMARSRGLPGSYGAMAGAWAAGTLILVAIVAVLIFGSS
jgi:hypothetical protein